MLSRLLYRLCLIATVAPMCAASSANAENWPRFRGTGGSGISAQQGIPTTWSPGDYAWNIELPGVGHASPIVWGDKLFITSAVDEGVVRSLYCLNANTGEKIWTRVIGMSRSHKHRKSSWASSTPVADGEQVFVAFADAEHYTLAAYDFSGSLRWRRSLGTFESQHGQGVSPILFESMVILPNLQKGPSSVVAFNKQTGRTVWSSPHTFYRTSYSTPLIVRKKGEQPQLICASGALGVASLNPFTGRLNWLTGEFPVPRRTVASPVYADGLIIQTCGGGGVGNVLIAVDPSNPGRRNKQRIRYRREKILPYVPTLISYQGHLYLWNDNGVVSCVKTKTGENVWTKRIGKNFSSSPICIDGKLYCISEDGEVVVVAASTDYQLLGKTALNDASHATPAVANGCLYLRTFHRLACLRAEP